RKAPRVDARSGEGRAHVDRAVAPECDSGIARCRWRQCVPRGDAQLRAESQPRAPKVRDERPALRRGFVALDGASKCLLGRRLVGRRLVGGCVLERGVVGGRLVGRRVLGRRFVGGRFVGGRFVGGRFVGGRLLGRYVAG